MAVAVTIHHRDDARRIDATREKRSQGHVRNHLHLHDAIQRFEYTLLPPAIASVLVDLVERSVPPLRDSYIPTLVLQVVTRRNCLHSLEQRVRIRRPEKGEKLMQRFW